MLPPGPDLAPAADSSDLRGYVGLLLRGGFPEAALRLGVAARRHWLERYVDHLVTRDAAQLEGGRDPVRLRRFLEAYSLNTAGVVEATAAPGPADARHLAGLRDRYPDTFVAGVVLHTGPRAYGLGERLAAAPISSLWGG